VWRKLHNEELNNLYSPPIIVFDQMENSEVSEPCSTYGERRVVYGVLVGKPEEKIPLGRPKLR
jgi:hypothetical protein